MGLCGIFRLTFGTRDFKYIIGTVPQESGRVVTLRLTATQEVLGSLPDYTRDIFLEV